MPTRIVWLTFIAAMDEDGYVQFASAANVAHRARVSLEDAEEALACLERDDPNSSDPDHAGKRIERVAGGWMVLNAKKHRELVTAAIIRGQTRERVRKFRERRQQPESNAPVTPSEALAIAEAEVLKTRTPAAPVNSPKEKRERAESNYKVIVTLLKKELLPQGFEDVGDLIEAAKKVCAERSIDYNSQVIRKAVDAVTR